ncbi:MAG: sortase [Nitriliruptor sp.]|nr:MAG: sortase [Nitriliruptor sp.]
MAARLRWALVALGAVLLVGTPAMWFFAQPSPTAGALPDALQVEEQGAAQDTPETSPTPAEPADETELQESASTGDITRGGSVTIEVAPVRPAKPVSVSIPSIGIEDADIAAVGLDSNGAVEIPDDVMEVGWYDRGPRPGEDGNAFMTSHVDSRTQGRGVLFDLRRSEPGDLIEVTHEDGMVSEWEVVFRERIVKGSYPMDRVFRFDGPPGLVIDTCGGPFNSNTGSYENIDIVYAVPLGADYSNVEVETAAQTG